MLSPAVVSTATDWSYLISNIVNVSFVMSANPDQERYSRVALSLGVAAASQLASSKVLILGMGAVGAELAKNLVLMGVRTLVLQDSALVQQSDLFSQFLLSSSDIGKNRAQASINKLMDMNDDISITAITESISEGLLENVDAVCVTQMLSKDDFLMINRMCRYKSMPMIIGTALGLFGSVFVDFGEAWTTLDATGEEPATAVVTNLDRDIHGRLVCTCLFPHRLSEGDTVEFEDFRGLDSLNGKHFPVVFVRNANEFCVDAPPEVPPFRGCGNVTQVKTKLSVSHQPLHTFLQPSNTDLEKKISLADVHGLGATQSLALWNAIEDFYSSHGRLPKFNDEKQVFHAENDRARFASQLAMIEFPPMAAVVAGVVAHEVIKASTHNLHPLDQWLFVDCVDCVPRRDLDLPLSSSNVGSSESYWTAIVGKEFYDRLKNKKCILVGAGATGGELAKLMAQMGFCTGVSGKLTIVDSDAISIQDLSTQLLYRKNDIGSKKADVASRFLNSLNSEMNIEANTSLGSSIPRLEDMDDLWEVQDVVLSACASDPQRDQLDEISRRYKKPLIDMGIHKSRGHVYGSVPRLSESLNSLSDQERERVDMGHTAFSFPLDSKSCYMWSLDHIFLGRFRVYCQMVNELLDLPPTTWLENPTVCSSLKNSRITFEDIIVNRPTSIEECAIWARGLFESSFVNSTKQLLFNFPPDSRDHHGNLFWSEQKRLPHPLEFDPDDPDHADFVVLGALLYTRCLRILPEDLTMDKLLQNRDTCLQAASKARQRQWEPERYAEGRGDKDEKDQSIPDYEMMDIEQNFIPVLKEKATEAMRTTPAPDGRNLETDPVALKFIHITGKLRGSVFDLKFWDEIQTHRRACNIIPTLVSTASVSSGFACLELLKSLRLELEPNLPPLEVRRNTFFNLALPDSMIRSQLAQAKQTQSSNSTFTPWDSIEVRGRPDMTLQELKDYLEVTVQATVDFIGAGNALVYAFFGAGKRRLPKRVVDAVIEVTKTPLLDNQRSFRFQVSCCSRDDENSLFEIPDVLFYFR